MNLRISFRTLSNISNTTTINRIMTIINSNIRDLEMTEMNHSNIRSMLNRRDSIKHTTMLKVINHKSINLVSISISQIIQTNRLLILLLTSIQRHRTTLTRIRDHFSLQIKTSTIIHLDLIHSKILHSRMIHQLLIKFVRSELRNLLNFRLDRMNSIEETTNTRARSITWMWKIRI
jgi:hypothetical protein